MTKDEVSIVISCFAALISCFSAAGAIANAYWNIYKDVRFRRRVGVRLYLAQVPPILMKVVPVIEIRNYGPNVVTLEVLITERRSWFERTFKPITYKIVVGDIENSSKVLPGQVFRKILNLHDFAGRGKPPDIGYRDSWHVEHWAPRSDIRRVARQVRRMPEWKDFGKKRVKAKLPPSPVLPPTKDENPS